MADKIIVVARIRPFVQSELQENDEDVTKVIDGRHLRLTSSTGITATKSFTFDRVLESTATQEETFHQIRPLLEYSIQGYNTSFFTYGQTGTGKTHTMLGLDLWNIAKEQGIMNNHIATDDVYIGVIPRSIRWLFSALDKQRNIVGSKIRISYAELYNDKLMDLLGSEMPRQSLDIRETAKGHIFVPGLTQIEVQNLEQVLEVLWIGAKTRSVAATDMNEYSSRSHTIFQVSLELHVQSAANISNSMPMLAGGDVQVLRSKISMVDLAGSEKWRSHQLSSFSQERINELTSINKSLSALGNCINALMKSTRGHVPYRDSKLTRLLQDSLGGNTRTAFIVTISPSIRNFEETASTLQFADRAMKVQVFANINKTVVSDPDAVSKYQSEIFRLTSFIKILLRKCNESGIDMQSIAHEANNELQSNGKGFDGMLPASLQLDMLQIRQERDSLMKQLLHTQETLRQCQDEKRKILETIFEGELAAVDSSEGLERILFSLDDGDDESMISTDPGRENVDLDNVNTEMAACALIDSLAEMYPSADNDTVVSGSPRDGTNIGSGSKKKISGSSRAAIQFRVLQALREEVDRRREALVAADIAQEDRWCWLQQYHAWLQAQAQLRMQRREEIGTEDISCNPAYDESRDVYDRVCLMETSVLLQSEELERAKVVFLKTNSELLSQLDTITKDRDSALGALRRQQELVASLTSTISDLREKSLKPTADPVQSHSLVTEGNRTRKPPAPPSHPPPAPAYPPPNCSVTTPFRNPSLFSGPSGQLRRDLQSVGLSPPPPPPDYEDFDTSPGQNNLTISSNHQHNSTECLNDGYEELGVKFRASRPQKQASTEPIGSTIDDVALLQLVDDITSKDLRRGADIRSATSEELPTHQSENTNKSAIPASKAVVFGRKVSAPIQSQRPSKAPTLSSKSLSSVVPTTTSEPEKSTAHGARKSLLIKSEPIGDSSARKPPPLATAARTSTIPPQTSSRISKVVEPSKSKPVCKSDTASRRTCKTELEYSSSTTTDLQQAPIVNSDHTLSKPSSSVGHSKKRNSQADLLAMAEEILNKHKGKVKGIADAIESPSLESTDVKSSNIENPSFRQTLRFNEFRTTSTASLRAVSPETADDLTCDAALNDPDFLLSMIPNTSNAYCVQTEVETGFEPSTIESHGSGLEVSLTHAVHEVPEEKNTDSGHKRETSTTPPTFVQDDRPTAPVKETKKSRKAKPVWREANDPTTGLPYFYNKLTGETTWDRPSEEKLKLMCIHGKVVDQ